MRFFLQSVLIILLIALSVKTNGQKIKGMYVSRPQENGMLYYVFPLTLFESRTDGNFIFDLTYLQPSDSITINFTYTQKNFVASDSVLFQSEDSHFGGKAVKIYAEAEKVNKWVHRYSLKCPIERIFSFFNQDDGVWVVLFANGREIEYAIRKAEWKKISPRLNSIFQTIRIECNK